MLDPSAVSVAVIGAGPGALRRLQWLQESGADPVVYAPGASQELVAAAGDHLVESLPGDDELLSHSVVWIVDLPRPTALSIAARARTGRVLVNVEDTLDGCDFHNPALVRRGDLLLTVSTGGKSPGLAARIKRLLADQFGPEWADRLNDLGDKRRAWRRRPRELNQLATLTDATIDAKGWLSRREEAA